MTSKYFGEFLVEKGVISEENLVDALIEQLVNTPPLCQIIHQKNILTPHKIFEAFRFQQENQVEFMQACKAIGAWTQDVQDKVFVSLDEIRKPLGHILVSKGLLDLKKLTNMLDEFLSQISAVNIIKPAESIVVSAPVTEEEPEAVTVAYLDEDLAESFQLGILMELDETFDEKKKKMVRIALSLIKDNAGGDVAICKKLLSDVFMIIHSLNGLLGLLAVDKLSEILNAVEERLTRIQPGFSERSKEQVLKDTEILMKGIDLAWSLRVSIIANKNERVFFSEEANRKQFSQVTLGLKGE